jgi:hypothetical protein
MMRTCSEAERRRKRAVHGILACLACVLVTLAAGATANAAAGELRWRSSPAQAPPPPEGVEPAPYPVPVGQVGEISFWEPNRGLLITGGAGPVPAGLYAYDGVSWHELSSVCGGAEGRIAWASPDDFWTVSDQRSGQTLGPNREAKLQSVSLCHFENGQVVGSYAMPLEEPDSYQKMDAAACYGPSDCWFGGETFHLNWNGSTLTEVAEPEQHAVMSMVVFGGQMYESVQFGGETYLPYEDPEHPAVIHKIAHEGQVYSCGEVQSSFCDLTIFASGKLLPEYGEGVQPDELQGFDLATNGSPLGIGATQLWAAATPRRATGAAITVLHGALKASGAIEWSQVVPGPHGESAITAVELGGSTIDRSENGIEDAIAPEPGSEAAWVALGPEGGGDAAEVARLDSSGALSEPAHVLSLPEPGEAIGYHGHAGPIVCPGAHDCWLATTDEEGPTPGWLFHYSDGEPVTLDTDPFFDGEDGVISYRPPDSGIPIIYPNLPPVDDSLINQQTEAAQKTATSSSTSPAASSRRAKPLLERVKSALVHGRTLVISFTLTARAHIRLVGRRKHKIVASTRAESLRPGHHELSLLLNPLAWPTAIQFHATPIGPAPTEPVTSEPSKSGLPPPPVGADSVETE